MLLGPGSGRHPPRDVVIYLLRRLALLPVTLFGVLTVSFLILRVVPGDPAIQLAGDTAQTQDIEIVRRELGLDRPIAVQYAEYMGRVVTGDLGRSFRTRRAVAEEVWAKLGATVTLAVAATTVAGLVGITGGVLAARRRRGLVDRLMLAGSVLGLSLPGFWLGLVLIWLAGVKANLLPVSGAEGVQSLVLPTLSLALGPAAVMVRTVRSSMIEVLQQDFVRTAVAKGLGRRAILMEHALRNALIPAVTLIGLNFGSLLAGAVIVEIVFSWPGLGRLLLEAIEYRDLPVIQGVTVTLAVLFLAANLAVDLAYTAIDPRIRRA